MSLIEILIALAILSTVLAALGGLMFQAARHTHLSAAIAYRGAAAEQAEAWIQNVPWDSLANAVGCTTRTTGPLVYSRCVSVADLSSRLKRVTVALTPESGPVMKPDTVVVDRNRPRERSTLSP